MPKRSDGLKDLKIRLTLSQIEWLRVESEKTGDSMSSVIRQLIQLQVNKGCK